MGAPLNKQKAKSIHRPLIGEVSLPSIYVGDVTSIDITSSLSTVLSSLGVPFAISPDIDKEGIVVNDNYYLNVFTKGFHSPVFSDNGHQIFGILKESSNTYTIEFKTLIDNVVEDVTMKEGDFDLSVNYRFKFEDFTEDLAIRNRHLLQLDTSGGGCQPGTGPGNFKTDKLGDGSNQALLLTGNEDLIDTAGNYNGVWSNPAKEDYDTNSDGIQGARFSDDAAEIVKFTLNSVPTMTAWTIAFRYEPKGSNINVMPFYNADNAMFVYFFGNHIYLKGIASHYLSNNLYDNQTHHYAFSGDGTSLKIFIDGVLVQTVADGVAIGGALDFGGSYATNYNTNAIFNNVEIYNKALSEAEVSIIMNNPEGIEIPCIPAAISTSNTSGLYKGETTVTDLVAIPTATLVEAISYYIDGKLYIWDADATEGAYEPTDKIGTDGFWVEVSGSGSLPLEVVQTSSNYVVDPTKMPILIEVDTTNDPNIEITLPPVVEGGMVYIKNVGTNDLTVIPTGSETVKGAISHTVLEGEYFQYVSDVPNGNWTDAMRELKLTAIQDYFFGMYVTVGPSGTLDNGNLWLDIINLSSSQTIDWFKYSVIYVISDGGGQVAHAVSGAINMTTSANAGINVTL